MPEEFSVNAAKFGECENYWHVNICWLTNLVALANKPKNLV